MADKSVARPMDIPDGRPIDNQGVAMADVMGPEPVDDLPEVSPEEEAQVDLILGPILDFIWDAGYDSIVKKLRAGQDNLPKTMGEIAGQMINREVKAASDAGAEVSRDILIGVAGETINAEAEVASHEGIYKKSGEQEQQADQGEALINAVEKYGNMGDPQMNPQGLMKMASNALSGGYPEEEMVSKMGMPVLPEMGGANAELG